MKTDLKRRTLLGAGAGLSLLSVVQSRAAEHGSDKAADKSNASAEKGVRLGLALGGGSARGFAHIGVIKALEQHNIRPDLVVGTSAGSIVGAFYAAGYSGLQMEETALKIRDSEVADLAMGSKRGMVVGDALQNLINQYLRNKPIESLQLPFGAVATNLRNGETTVFRFGNAGFAVRASSSIPGIFIPARQGQNEFVDGGLVSPLPVRETREMGADIVIAVDVSAPPQNANLYGMFELLMQSFEIMGQSLIRLESEKAEILIRPDVAKFNSSDFSARAALIAAGYNSTLKQIPAIKDRLMKMSHRV
jgi:NTE family protein